MKRIYLRNLTIFIMVFIAAMFFGSRVNAATSSDIIYLSPGWNIISTPRIVSSHSFSATENSSNFDIYVLVGSNWSTMAGIGQTEFTPLYGYFINNKTGTTQSLTLNYADNTTPNQRLFSMPFNQTGWYSIGPANPTYMRSKCDSTNNIGNVGNILYSFNGYYSSVLDFTSDSFNNSPNSVAVGNNWKAVVPTDLNSLNDFRELKGYADYINKSGGTYSGFQNTDQSQSCSPPAINVVAASTSTLDIYAGAFNKIGSYIIYSPNTEGVSISSLSVEIATSSYTNYQDLVVKIGGKQFGATTTVTSSTDIYNFSGTPEVISAGSSTTIDVYADVVSNPTFPFSPATFLCGCSGTTTFSNTLVSCNKVEGETVASHSSAQLIITIDPTFAANKIFSQASNVTLGQWVAKAYGEDVRVGQWEVQLDLTGTSTAGNYINNVAIYVNGAQVGSAQNWAVGSSTNASTTLTFGSGNLFTMTAGTQYVVAVKGDTSLASSTTGIVATLVEVQNQSQGLTSYTTFPSSTVSHTGQSLSFSNSSLTIAVNPAYSNQTIGSNVSKQKIGSYVLQASNIDSIQVTQITVGLGGTLALTNLSNLYVSDNTNPQYPQSQNTFAVNFTIPAGQSHTVDVFADIGNATGTVTTSISVAARAVTSNTQVGSAAGTVSGQTISVGQGVLSAPTLVQSQSLQSQYVIGGTSGQQLAVYNFVSTGGSANVTDLTFQVVSGTSSPTITGITVGGQSGTFAYNGATGTVTISGLSISVPGNDYAGVNVPVTVTYVPVGANGSNSGVTTTLALTSVKYTSGGTTVTTSTNVAANTVMLVGAAPLISVSNTSASGLVAGQNKLFEFTVGSQGGTIAVGTTTFNISASGIATPTVASAQLYVGSNSLTDSICNTATTTSGWTVTCTFPSDYRLSGSGQTFALYADVGGTFANSGQSSVTTQLGKADTFSWSDVSGKGGPYTTDNSKYLYNYPTATWSVHN